MPTHRYALLVPATTIDGYQGFEIMEIVDDGPDPADIDGLAALRSGGRLLVRIDHDDQVRVGWIVPSLDDPALWVEERHPDVAHGDHVHQANGRPARPKQPPVR